MLEIDERLTADGEVLIPLDVNSLDEPLKQWKQMGIEAVAICLLHSFVNPVHEELIATRVRGLGFDQVSVSHQVAPMIKLVSRAETTVLDAYLTPVGRSVCTAAHIAIQSWWRSITRAIDDQLRQSGGRQHVSRRRQYSLRSSRGVIALSKLAERFECGLIGLDMGGTSTDVCRYAGRIPRDFESQKAGVRVLAPMMSIHTVAAGGGSICDLTAGRMTVGPQSAGSLPGPACYGRGGPLTVTDLNVVLGRLPTDRFPFALDLDAAKQRLSEVNAKLVSDVLRPSKLQQKVFWRLL